MQIQDHLETSLLGDHSEQSLMSHPCLSVTLLDDIHHRHLDEDVGVGRVEAEPLLAVAVMVGLLMWKLLERGRM